MRLGLPAAPRCIAGPDESAAASALHPETKRIDGLVNNQQPYKHELSCARHPQLLVSPTTSGFPGRQRVAAKCCCEWNSICRMASKTI